MSAWRVTARSVNSPAAPPAPVEPLGVLYVVVGGVDDVLGEVAVQRAPDVRVVTRGR